MSLLRRFERGLDEKLRKVFAPSAGQQTQGRELLEIHRAILEDVAARVQPLRRGKRAFPYNRLTVHLYVPDGEQRALFQMVFGEGEELRADIREHLMHAGCEPPADLEVEIVLSETPEIADRGFHVLYQTRETASKVKRELPHMRLVVLQGRAAQDSYLLSKSRVNVGRLADVTDDQQRLIRRNDVVFLEAEDPINATVSRAHAHFQFDAASGEFRLFDDGSAYGTSLFREGALLQVPSGASRGLAPRPGDEIYFGQARVRLEEA